MPFFLSLMLVSWFARRQALFGIHARSKYAMAMLDVIGMHLERLTIYVQVLFRDQCIATATIILIPFPAIKTLFLPYLKVSLRSTYTFITTWSGYIAASFLNAHHVVYVGLGLCLNWDNFGPIFMLCKK